jgi:hypothetical protein
MVGLELQNLLEERECLWIKALVGEVIGNAGVLLDAPVQLVGANV